MAPSIDPCLTEVETEGTEHEISQHKGRESSSTDAAFWVVDGVVYDFSAFMDKHPGGAVWFKRSVKRDISVLVHTYHLDPQKKIMPLLKKYRITRETHPSLYKDCCQENLFPKLGIVTFVLPPDFDARTDLLRYDFQQKNSLLDTVRKTIVQPEFQKKIKSCNWWWDLCCYIAIAAYAINFAAFFFVNNDDSPVSIWVCVVAFVILRTSFGAFGHYYLHAKKPNWLEVLFDANYVGFSQVAFDAHVMLHHAHTHTGADVKTRFFGGMWTLPPLYRPIGYTLQHLGTTLCGSFLKNKRESPEMRASKLGYVFRGSVPPSSWPFRVLLSAEFALAIYTGKFLPFFIQFVISLWYNTFLVVSSHDFEDFYVNPLKGEHKEDWGIFQLKNCHDLTLFGNKYVDVMMSAGLSSHRAHHLLPYQTSGFANIVSEPVIAKVLPDFGLEWERPKLVWTERFPYVFKFCFMQPTIGMEDRSFVRQHLSMDGIVKTFNFCVSGFISRDAI